MYVATNLYHTQLDPAYLPGPPHPETLWVDFAADACQPGQPGHPGKPDAQPRLTYLLTPGVYAWLMARLETLTLSVEAEHHKAAEIAVGRARPVIEYVLRQFADVDIQVARAEFEAAPDSAREGWLPRPQFSKADVLRMGPVPKFEAISREWRWKHRRPGR
jgi:hypothetical protein